MKKYTVVLTMHNIYSNTFLQIGAHILHMSINLENILLDTVLVSTSASWSSECTWDTIIMFSSKKNNIILEFGPSNRKSIG